MEKPDHEGVAREGDEAPHEAERPVSAERPADPIATIAELFGGAAADAETDEADPPAERPPQGGDAVGLDDEGESPGDDDQEPAEGPGKISPEDYARVVPIDGEDEPLTVGALKDFYQEHRGWQGEREAWDTERDGQKRELLQARNEFASLINELGPNVTPELMQAVTRKRAEEVRRESLLMLKAVPEWRENARYQADREALGEFVQRYGVSTDEFQSVTDHRLVLMAYEAMKADRRLKAAQEKANGKAVTPPPPKPRKPSRNGDGRFRPNPKRPTTRAGQTAAIAELLGKSK